MLNKKISVVLPALFLMACFFVVNISSAEAATSTVTTSAQFKTAIASTTVTDIIIGANISIGTTTTIINRSVIIDFNSKTISNAFLTIASGTVTIKNGTLSGPYNSIAGDGIYAVLVNGGSLISDGITISVANIAYPKNVGFRVASGASLTLKNSVVNILAAASSTQQYAVYTKSGASNVTLENNTFSFSAVNTGTAYSSLIGMEGDTVSNYPSLNFFGTNTSNAYRKLSAIGVDTVANKKVYAAAGDKVVVGERLGLGATDTSQVIYARTTDDWNNEVKDATSFMTAIANTEVPIISFISSITLSTTTDINRTVIIDAQNYTISAKPITISGGTVTLKNATTTANVANVQSDGNYGIMVSGGELIADNITLPVSNNNTLKNVGFSVTNGASLTLKNSRVNIVVSTVQQYAVYTKSGASNVTLENNTFSFNAVNTGPAYSSLIGMEGDTVSNYPTLNLVGANTSTAYTKLSLIGVDTIANKTAYAVAGDKVAVGERMSTYDSTQIIYLRKNDGTFDSSKPVFDLIKINGFSVADGGTFNFVSGTAANSLTVKMSEPVTLVTGSPRLISGITTVGYFNISTSSPDILICTLGNASYVEGTLTFKVAAESLRGAIALNDEQSFTITYKKHDLQTYEQHLVSSSIEVATTTTGLILNYNSAPVETITVPDTIKSNKKITLDMSALQTGTGTPLTLGDKQMKLERKGVHNYSAILPPGTVITGTSTWNGIIELPTVTTLPATSLGNIETVINIGSDEKLTFSNAVKVMLGGMTGKRALWSDDSGTHSMALCSDATDSTSGSLASPGECYIDTGTDLVIWTFHFTKFGAYTPSVPASSGSAVIVIEPTTLSKNTKLDFTINNNDKVTNLNKLDISLNADPKTVSGYAVSLDSNFTNSSIIKYSPNIFFNLPSIYGKYAIYLKYFSISGHQSPVIIKTIEYNDSTSSLSKIKNETSLNLSSPVITKFNFKKDLKLGQANTDIKELQKYLNTNGYIISKSGVGSKGKETNYFGPATKAALIKFQKAKKISPATGLFGPMTRKVVNGK
jgi:hypothetical protein